MPATGASPHRIAFVLPHMDAGGLERVVLNLLVHLDRRRFLPLLILQSKRGAFLCRVPPDVAITDLGGVPLRRAVPVIKRALESAKPDSVYTGTNAMNLAVLSAAKLMRKKPRVVISEHGPPSLYLRESKWRPLRLRAMRYLYPSAAGIVVPVPQMAEDLRQMLRLPDLDVLVLPNPVVDMASLRQDAVPAPGRWAESQGPVFVGAGRLSPEKGFDVLCRAFARLRVTHLQAHLLILGDGPERANLEGLARELGVVEHIEFAGYVDHVSDYFRQATAFILSSRREGFGNVLIEAMAVGLPVIAVDCPVGPRGILNDGEAGILVKIGDTEALTAAMKTLADDRQLHGELSRKGLARAQEFDVCNTVPKFEVFFESLAVS